MLKIWDCSSAPILPRPKTDVKFKVVLSPAVCSASSSSSSSSSSPSPIFHPPLLSSVEQTRSTALMECVSVVLLDPTVSSLRSAVESGLSFLWNLLTQGAADHLYLGRNADALAREAQELLEEQDDLLAQLAEQEGPRRRRTHQVRGWLGRVEAIRAEVAEFESAFDRRVTCFEGCSLASLHANYRLGRAAADQLGRVRALRDQRRGLAELVGPAPPVPVEAVPNSAGSIVGGEKTLSEIRRYLMEDGARIIGICGMGGVGKTTLLMEINNKLLAAADHGFDMVIWVTVSRDLDVPRIQKQIGDRLGVSLSAEFSGPASAERIWEQAKTLFDRLSGEKKSLLFLDDVWDKLDLEKIGIPYPSARNQCRVVFTTRSTDVCTQMDARVQLQVSCLNPTDSWQLFCDKMGAEVDIHSPQLRPLVEAVVAKCGGLPLALVTAARAMAHATTAGEWEEAIEVLNDSPEKLSGMEDEVLCILKFSFDRLKDETVKECLLYCALFPEDGDVEVERLVEYWVGEGFLDTNSYHRVNIDRARNRGLVIIRKLKSACLLENGALDGDRYVKMHDTVREMCIWLTSGEYVGSNTFLVYAGNRLSEVPSTGIWKEAKRISLMHNDVVALPDEIPSCPALVTLLIKENRSLRSVPRTIFGLMPELCTLDLSFTNLEEIPIEIGLLLQLRFLNLSGTKIRALPKELGQLVNLRQLILRGTPRLEHIPSEAMLRLSNLQTLDLVGSTYEWIWGIEQNEGSDLHSLGDGEARLSLNDVERLEQLSDLALHITTSSGLGGFLGSSKLLRCMRFLRVLVPDFEATSDLSQAFLRMDRLKRLEFFDCAKLKGDLIIGGGGQLRKLEHLYLSDLPRATSVVAGTASSLLPGLRILILQECHSIRELAWVARLPCLEEFGLFQNEQIEELAGGETGDEASHLACSFPKLKKMKFQDLPRLRVISRHPLLFPALEQLYVRYCPELRRLPLRLCSAKRIKEIRGEQEWWDALEWESPEEATILTFLPHFRRWGV